MPTITITLANAQQHAHELIVDVLNKEFGTNYKGYQKSTWNVTENAVVWFPTLSDGTTDFEGWQNVLSPDGETIEAKYVGDDPSQKITLKITNVGRYHIVFARTEVPGRRKFIGVFDNRYDSDKDKRIYRRIATELMIDTSSREVTWLGKGKEDVKNDNCIVKQVIVRVREKSSVEKIILGCAPYFVILVLGGIALWGLLGMPGYHATNVSTKCVEKQSYVVTNAVGEVRNVQETRCCVTNKWE